MNTASKLKFWLNRKQVYGLLSISLLASACLLLWYFYQAKLNGKIPPIPVETQSVRVGPSNHILPAIGILHSNEAIIVRPEVSGKIAKIFFTEGQMVEKGQILIAMEDSIAQANLKEAQAELKQRKLEFNRAEILLQRAAGSITDKEAALTKLAISEASLAKAQSMLDKMNITAAFEGYVGMRKVNVGDCVTPGQELVNLVDLDPIKLDFRVPEIYLEKIKVDQSVDVFTDALPHQKFVGRIYAIDPQIDPIGHSILIRAIIDNKDNILRPGLFAKIEIIIEHLENSLFIPAEALIPQEQKQFVYKVDNNHVILTEVKVGERKQNEVEILAGLQPDDVVVTAGHMKINHGTKIKPLPARTFNKKISEEQKDTILNTKQVSAQ